MMLLSILVRIVTTRQQEKDVWRHIESLHDDNKYSCPHCDHQATHKENLKTHINLFMMVLNILVLIVTTNQHKKEVWIGTYKLYMRVLNIFVFIVITKQRQRMILGII